ncbi:MAG: dUTP diphosphatase [Cyanobacteria bacterium]|nr:dUTP diphosphatase [Cyanobacteriota bacterium]
MSENHGLNNPGFILVPITPLAHAPENLPAYQTPGSVGMDVQAALTEPLTLEPLQRTLIPTGFIVCIPEGFEIQVRARSGISIKYGITLINGVGTIDSDYRDELKIPLVNLSNEAYTIQPGDRIAQLVLAPVIKAGWHVLPSLEAEKTLVRQGGFGSTGR